MNDEKNKIMSSEELDGVLPKYEPIKLSGKNLAQNYVSAFNTGMNIYQCVNQLQGYIEWVVKAVNDVVKLWNVQVGESIDESKAIVRETTTEQFNTEWINKQPELIEQVNTLTTNQFNNEKSIFNDELNALNARMDTFSNPNLLINPNFKVNQRGKSTYSSTGEIYTVDRWSVSNATTIVNSDGTITISSLSELGYCNYRIEDISYGKHAYSLYVQAITGDVNVYYRNKNDLDINLGTLKQGLNTFTSPNDDGFKRLIIVISNGASVTLKYAKIEKGSVSTMFVEPDYANELVKCQRYYMSRKLRLYGVCNVDTIVNEDLQYLPQMRIEPTFTKSIEYDKNIDKDSIEFFGTNSTGYYLYLKSTTSSSSSQYILGITINADAEIY